MNLTAFINWFIHPNKRDNGSEHKKSRLFVRASLLTSLFSNSYIWFSVYFQFDLGVQLMIFNVVGFLILSFLSKTRIPTRILGHLYVLVGAIAVVVLTYYSGGIYSGIYPWIISIPMLALLVVGRNAGILWGILSFGIMIWLGVLAINGHDFPKQYNTDLHTEWFVTIVPGLLLIIMIIALVFESEQRKALGELASSNQVLTKQKDTIEKQSQKLEKLLDEKDQIIRIMAHDLKNPLTNITSLSELLRNMESSEEQQKIIGMIEQVSGKAQDMIGRVLEMAILEQGGVVVRLEQLDLMKIVNNAVNELGELANRKEIRIDVETVAETLKVMSDKTYLQLVFENLISNALKFSNRNTSVKVMVQSTEDQVQIKVTDEGPGIKEEEQHLLFQKFTTLSARPTAGETSTGIGLSLVKTYVEKLNGDIWYDDSVSTGATFVVELPLAS